MLCYCSTWTRLVPTNPVFAGVAAVRRGPSNGVLELATGAALSPEKLNEEIANQRVHRSSLRTIVAGLNSARIAATVENEMVEPNGIEPAISIRPRTSGFVRQPTANKHDFASEI